MAERGDIIVFRKFETAIEANIVKAKLDAYGVPCFLTEESLAHLYPGANSLMNSDVRLLLFAEDRDKAELILQEKHLEVDDETIIRCPKCKSRNVERDFPKKFWDTLGSALNVMFFGVFFPHKKVFRCLDCEHEFNA
jgi:hypothetical protein